MPVSFFFFNLNFLVLSPYSSSDFTILFSSIPSSPFVLASLCLPSSRQLPSLDFTCPSVEQGSLRAQEWLFWCLLLSSCQPGPQLLRTAIANKATLNYRVKYLQEQSLINLLFKVLNYTQRTKIVLSLGKQRLPFWSFNKEKSFQEWYNTSKIYFSLAAFMEIAEPTGLKFCAHLFPRPCKNKTKTNLKQIPRIEIFSLKN